jgi:hypothetical protein
LLLPTHPFAKRRLGPREQELFRQASHVARKREKPSRQLQQKTGQRKEGMKKEVRHEHVLHLMSHFKLSNDHRHYAGGEEEWGNHTHLKVVKWTTPTVV